MSQAKLAARAELDPSTVNQIERGAREASPATLRKLADALDVGIADLLEDVSPKAGSSSPDPKLFNGIDGERRPSVFAEVLINAADQLEHTKPPESLGDVSRTFGILEMVYSIAEPLIELTDDRATWEDQFSDAERKEILDVGARLHQVGKQLLKPVNEYLDRLHEGIEDLEASRQAQRYREQIREWNRRLSA